MSDYPTPLPSDEQASERMSHVITHVLLVCVLVVCTFTLVLGVLFARTQSAPVCHAPTEDSVITDCDYRDGAWHKE